MRARRWFPVVVAVLVSVAVLVPAARLHRSDRPVDDVVAHLHHLRDRLHDGAGEDAQRLFPEGYFFSHVLYGLAWLDAGTVRPALRAEALREARWALRRLDSTTGRAPFDAGLRPAYGVFYAGWTGRLRGGIVGLAGAGAPEATRHARACAALARAFTADGPFLEAYPGRAWPVDSVVGVAALRTCGPGHRDVVTRWVRQAKERTDPATGLLPHEVTSPPTGARGSSQAVIQRFLPEVDLEWARQQYERFRRQFVTTRLSLPGVLEYPAGSEGPGDVDSGPLILGVSASATVVTLGAAHAHGDTALAADLTGLAEATGVPVRLPGTTRYAFGVLPIGEAFLAWAVLAHPPAGVSTPPFPERAVPAWWRLPWNALAVLLVAACWTPVLLRRLRMRARR